MPKKPVIPFTRYRTPASRAVRLVEVMPCLETWTFIPIAQDVLRTVLRTVRVPGLHRQGEAGSRGGPCSQEPVPPGSGCGTTRPPPRCMRHSVSARDHRPQAASCDRDGAYMVLN